MSIKIQNCQTVTCRMPKEMADHLRRIAISMSKQSGRVVSLSEFIRETMVKLYPIPKQEIMFPQKERKKLRRKVTDLFSSDEKK